MSMQVDASPARRGRSLPFGFFGMLAIVASFEWFVAAHSFDFSDGPAADWKRTGRASTAEALDAEILCFGSSLLKFGLVPDLIEKRTGLRTFNLSLLGGQAPSSYFLLRRVLEAGAKPKLILLDCQDMPSKPGHDHVRGLSLPLHMTSWPELLSLRELFELSCSARDSTFFGSVFIRESLPSYRRRRELRGELGQLVRKGTTNLRAQNLINGRNWRINCGSILMPPKPGNKTRVTSDQRKLPRCEWALDPVTSEYLREFFALAASNGVQVVWLIPPTSPEHEGLRVSVGQHEHMTQVAREFQAAFAGLVVIDGRTSGYDRSVFIDDSHLSKPGAVAFTGEIAEVIARIMERAQPTVSWVELPRYRESVEVAKFEDTNQSRLALKELLRTVR
jgi:hypothetical protein